MLIPPYPRPLKKPQKLKKMSKIEFGPWKALAESQRSEEERGQINFSSDSFFA
jgi:hypothetical protein